MWGALIGAAGSLLGGGGLGGGGESAPPPPPNMNSAATSGGSTGGAFVFGKQSKSSLWPIVAIVGVLVVGMLVWIRLRGGNKR